MRTHSVTQHVPAELIGRGHGLPTFPGEVALPDGRYLATSYRGDVDERGNTTSITQLYIHVDDAA